MIAALLGRQIAQQAAQPARVERLLEVAVGAVAFRVRGVRGRHLRFTTGAGAADGYYDRATVATVDPQGNFSALLPVSPRQ